MSNASVTLKIDVSELDIVRAALTDYRNAHGASAKNLELDASVRNDHRTKAAKAHDLMLRLGL